MVSLSHPGTQFTKRTKGKTRTSLLTFNNKILMYEQSIMHTVENIQQTHYVLYFYFNKYSIMMHAQEF